MATVVGFGRRASGNRIAGSGDGFTLLEVVLAMAIFAVVAALAYSCYAAIVTAVRYTRQETAVYRQAAVAMQRIREDLQAAVVFDPTDPDRLRGRELFQGRSNADDQPLQAELRFRTMARLGLDDGGRIRESGLVGYHVEQGGSGGGRLIRRDLGLPGASNSGGVDGSLCEGLQQVRFRFLDAEGEGHSRWPPETLGEEEKTGPPAAVEVRLLFAGDRQGRPPLVFRSTVRLPPLKWP